MTRCKWCGKPACKGNPKYCHRPEHGTIIAPYKVVDAKGRRTGGVAHLCLAYVKGNYK